MILVVFGNAPFTFFRLAEKIDALAGAPGEEFFVQCGHTDFPFRNARAVKFMDHSTLQKHMAAATVLVSHGGCGTLCEAMRMGKKIVAVPRLAGEHNHSQRELVEALENEGCLLAVYDIADLEKQVHAARGFTPRTLPQGNAGRIIGDFIGKHFPDGRA